MRCTYVSQRYQCQIAVLLLQSPILIRTHLKWRDVESVSDAAEVSLFFLVGIRGCLMPISKTTFRQVSRNLLLDCFKVKEFDNSISSLQSCLSLWNCKIWLALHVPRSFSGFTYRIHCRVVFNKVDYHYTCHHAIIFTSCAFRQHCLICQMWATWTFIYVIALLY